LAGKTWHPEPKRGILLVPIDRAVSNWLRHVGQTFIHDTLSERLVMITRRDLCVALVAACSTCAAVVWAQSPGMPVLRSTVFDWSQTKAAPTPTGEKRVFMSTPTATLDQLGVHATTINPGQRAHEPHRHWEEELIIVKEGTVESMQNGETTVVGPGSIIFEASNELHGLRNAGDTPATYLVIKWFPPGSLKSQSD